MSNLYIFLLLREILISIYTITHSNCYILVYTFGNSFYIFTMFITENKIFIEFL